MAVVAPMDVVALDSKPPLDLGIRLRLSVMMLLQFGIWGGFFTVLSVYLKNTLKFDGAQIGSIYATIPLGAIISMMFAGQLADRLLSSEYLMAIFHLAGAAMLYFLAQQTSFTGVWWMAFIWSLLYSPTLSISSALAFSNIPDATRDFPSLRVLGTIGWIIAASSVDWFLPDGAAATNQPILLSAALSVALGLFSFMLPHTPPAGQGGGAFPFLKAFGLLRDPSMALFFVIAFAITTALAFYYTWTGPFLESAGVKNVPSTMAIGQWSEILFLLALPFALRRFGMKAVLAIGMAAWVMRYGAFSIASDGSPFVLILLGVALHGVCFDFFLAAGFIYMDTKAPAAIRSSAQALFGFVVYGVGMFIGSEISGRVVQHYSVTSTLPDGSTVVSPIWDKVWLIPAIGAAVCLVLFLLFWRDRVGKVIDDSATIASAANHPNQPAAAIGEVV